jgi:hypothetical protein
LLALPGQLRSWRHVRVTVDGTGTLLMTGLGALVTGQNLHHQLRTGAYEFNCDRHIAS